MFRSSLTDSDTRPLGKTIDSLCYTMMHHVLAYTTWKHLSRHIFFRRAASVQSRIKALEKLPNLEAVCSDPALTFKFGEPEELPTPVLQLDAAWFTYKKEAPLPPSNSDDWVLKDVDLSVDLQSRLAVGWTPDPHRSISPIFKICGVNGCGKSTLLRLLSGASEPSRGFCRRANKLRIGFFRFAIFTTPCQDQIPHLFSANTTLNSSTWP